MDLEGRSVWQVSAGNGDKNYASLCLQNDVIIVGPGREGKWPECEKPLLKDPQWTKLKMAMLRHFADHIQPRDLIVLRMGTQTVYGVGEVVGPYAWKSIFGDVQGWDLQHTRRVRWLWKNEQRPKTFPVYTLKFGSSVQHMISAEVFAWLASLDIPPEAYARPLAII